MFWYSLVSYPKAMFVILYFSSCSIDQDFEYLNEWNKGII